MDNWIWFILAFVELKSSPSKVVSLRVFRLIYDGCLEAYSIRVSLYSVIQGIPSESGPEIEIF